MSQGSDNQKSEQIENSSVTPQCYKGYFGIINFSMLRGQKVKYSRKKPNYACFEDMSCISLDYLVT